MYLNMSCNNLYLKEFWLMAMCRISCLRNTSFSLAVTQYQIFAWLATSKFQNWRDWIAQMCKSILSLLVFFCGVFFNAVLRPYLLQIYWPSNISLFLLCSFPESGNREDNKQVSSVIHEGSCGLSPSLAEGLSAPTAHTASPTPAVLLEL